MAKRTRAERVMGIGGIFFRADDPAALAAWYRENLGIATEGAMAIFEWRAAGDAERRGHTVWSIFPRDTTYFGRDGKAFMINYRVRDLDAVLDALRKAGVAVDPKVERSEYGSFGWITDPEGNRIELWEPPKGDRQPETSIPME